MQIISLILDILVIAMIFFPILNGFRRGLKGTVLMLIAMVISSCTGLLGSKLLAPKVYERYLSKSVHEFCIENSVGYDPISLSQNVLTIYGAEMSREDILLLLDESEDTLSYAGELAELGGVDEEQIQELVDRLSSELLQTAPEAVQNTMPGLIKELFTADLSSAQTFDAVRAAASSPEEIAVFSEENYVRPIATALVRMILFSIICLITRFIIYAVYSSCHLDVNGIHAKRSDRTAGAVLGSVQGIAMMIVLALVVNAIEKTSMGLFTADRLNSVIFMPIYRLFFG